MTMSRMVPVVALAMFLGASRARAQDDFRHVDDRRPLRVEDAYPIKFREWEWEIGVDAATAKGGDYEVMSILELKTGVARNFQVGVEIHSAAGREAGTTQSGVEAFAMHLLFNLNQEGRVMPAVAVRGDFATPGIGDIGNTGISGRLRGMATRSVGGFRVHANGAHTWAADGDGGSFWSAGLALDHPLGLSSRLVLGDVYIEVPSGGGDARVWADFGSRWQLTKALVLDVGLFSRLDEWTAGTPNLGLTVGLSRSFGFVGLVNVPPYPNPRIN